MRPPALVALSLAVVSAVAVGCGGGTLKVTKLGASAQRPANVALYLSVFDKVGQPVGGLVPANFRVYEDKKLIPEGKAKRALLDTGIASTRYALLLVDMSGPMVDSEDLPDLAKAVGQFVDKVGASQSVAVDVFDGGDEVAPLFGFGANMETAKIVDAVRKFRPRNRTTNLNGAVFQGLAALKEQLDQATTTEKGASLVVFTDRGDLAHSVNAAVLEQALKDTPVDVYVIATGEKVSRTEIAAIGHSGIVISARSQGLQEGVRPGDRQARHRQRRALHLLLLHAQAERGPHAAARGGGSRRQGRAVVRVQRRQLQGRLHAQEAPQLQRPRRVQAVEAATASSATARLGRRRRSGPQTAARKLARSLSVTSGSPSATSSSLPACIQASSSLTSANRWSNESTM